MEEVFSKKRVCVVGAGASGLCAAKNLAENSKFEFSVYEQTEDVGGTWVYKDETTVSNESDNPIHTSMYQNLRTNLPGKIMNFPDFQRMGNEDHTCLTHIEVLAYLRDYVKHFDLRKFIQFNTKVLHVQPKVLNDRSLWTVTVKNLKSLEIKILEFDFIMVCNGHYFDPNIPSLPGMQTFPGRILHSHSYRKPEGYSGKIVFILGASSSGIDIGFDIANYANHVYLSHNNERLPDSLPSNVTQVIGLDRIEGNTFFLKDGTSVVADDFIFCTGYRYSFPFLDETCAIRVDENYVTPLYKHLINIEYPTMCIVGIPTIVVPFPMFHMQVKYFLALISSRFTLPPKSEMLDDSKLKAAKKRHAHKLADKQWEYNDSLAAAGNFEGLPPFYKLGYVAWGKQKKSDLLHYKDSKFIVSEDGNTVRIIPKSET